MRQTRLTIKRRRQMKRNLYIKPLVTVYIVFLLLALTVDGTAAKFNDIASVEGTFQVGEWTPDIPWDHSSLTFVKGVKGDCEQITATVKNTGDDMKSPWKYHVHRKAKSDWPRVEGFEGEIELLENKETVEVSFTPEENGQYRFEFVRPEGYQGNKGGKSGVVNVKDCEEKQSVNSQDHNDKKNNQDDDHADKEENNNEKDQKDKGNNGEESENKGSSNQENNEEQVEEDTESKQDNVNNQESEQKSKDQETKEEKTDEKAEDSSSEDPDDKDDQKKKQQNTKDEQQQDSEQEASAETDSNDDKQQDNQTSKSQDSKDDDTQVKEEESSNDDQNENE